MSRRSWWPAAAVFAVDWLLTMLVLLELDLVHAPPPVIAAALLRSWYLPALHVAVLLLLPGERWRRWLGGSLALTITLGVLAVVLYRGYFGSVPHITALRQAGALPEVVPQILHQLADVAALAVLLLGGSGLGLVCLPLRWPRPKPVRPAVAVAVLLILFPGHLMAARSVHDRVSSIPAERWYVYSLPEAALRFGLVDLWWNLGRNRLEHRRYAVTADDPGKIDPPPGGPAGEPLCAGMNVIMLQVESLDPWVVDHAVDGRPVMPFLAGLRDRALVVPNFFAQHSGGGSADAELAAMLSLLPLATHSGLLSMDDEVLTALPEVAAGAGYATAILHANRGSYFNRNLSAPRLGFERLFWREAFTGAARGWGSSDQAFLDQASDLLGGLPEPFFAWLITLQSHGPFRNHAPRPRVDPGEGHSRLERDYLQVMHEVDRALAGFVTALEVGGRFDRSLLVIFGDHLSQVREGRVAGKEPVPLYLLAPGLKAGTVERLGSHLDLAPTVARLMGWSEPPGWLGTSLLAGGDGVVLFNDLSEIRRGPDGPETRRADERMPFLLFSAVRLDP